MSEANIIQGDNRETLATLPAGHFHCCVTSPPYYGLRDYGAVGQIGQEPTPDDFVDAIREVFRGVWRVLRDDGVAWLNLGDSYAGSGRGGNGGSPLAAGLHESVRDSGGVGRAWVPPPAGLKQKDLCGIPWRVAFALQADGWYLRDAIIWHKPAPMPGSQRDRCTSAYEIIFQLTKSRRYFFDLDAIKEATSAPRNVWTIASSGYKGAHFATFPVALPLRCIKASTSAKGCCPACGAPSERLTERVAISRARPNELTKRTGEAGTGNHCANTVAGVEAKTIGWGPTCACGCDRVEPCRVLDPFNGAGTTGVACRRLGVDYTGCELNQEYIDMSLRRLARESNRDSKLKPVKAAVGQAELF